MRLPVLNLALRTVFLGVVSPPDTKAAETPGRESAADPSVEIRRTKPDFVLYDPTGGKPPAWSDPDFFWLNEHILVQPNGRAELLAMWTSERLKPGKWRIQYADSEDGGGTWSDAKVLDGPRAAWQVPVVSPTTGRIYVFHTHGFLSGGMRCHTSDDGGRTSTVCSSTSGWRPSPAGPTRTIPAMPPSRPPCLR